MNAARIFSADYGEARAKFLAACDATNAPVEPFRNPNTGPSGEPLFTDVAALGPVDADRALLLCSGTHGVEGFAGSAIQTGLLRDGITSRLPDGVRLVMIHALNPFGFAHLRRANDDNVDLNRNFVDHAVTHPANPAYEALASAIALRYCSRLAAWVSLIRLQCYGLIHGRAKLRAAISSGQYTHPDGLFYGGPAETWSNRTFRAVVSRHLADAARVAFVDLHTGLGPFGHGEVMVSADPGSAEHRRALAWWGERVKSVTAGESVSTYLTGATKLSFDHLRASAEVTAATLEFGTFPAVTVLRAMQAENWLHHHGGADHPRAAAIKAEMRRVFYPDTDDWKDRVWQQGRAVAAQALAGLAEAG